MADLYVIVAQHGKYNIHGHIFMLIQEISAGIESLVPGTLYRIAEDTSRDKWKADRSAAISRRQLK